MGLENGSRNESQHVLPGCTSSPVEGIFGMFKSDSEILSRVTSRCLGFFLGRVNRFNRFQNYVSEMLRPPCLDDLNDELILAVS